MINRPIWQETKYTTTGDVYDYEIEMKPSCEVIYSGYAKRMPTSTGISINVGAKMEEYLKGDIEDIEVSDEVMENPDAYQTCQINHNLSAEEEYAFLYDWSYEDGWTGQTKWNMSKPINGHCDPRQKALFTYFNTDDTAISTAVTFTPTLSVTPTSYDKKYNESWDEMVIETNAGIGWTASTNVDWIELTPSSGTGEENIELDFPTNTGDAQKSAIITINANNEVYKTIPFTQSYAWLNTNVSAITYEATGETKNVTITSNANWTVSTPSWITASTASGVSGTSTISLTASSYTGTTERTGNITFTYFGKTKNVGVSQTGIVEILYYNSTDSSIIRPASVGVEIFGANLLSNTYQEESLIEFEGKLGFDRQITKIGDEAFYEKSTLYIITIPTGVTSIGTLAFYGCTSLGGITIPDNVVSIGDYSFYNCTNFKAIEIGSGVTSIGEGAFKDCSSLNTIKAFPTIAPTLSDDVFDGLPDTGTFEYPYGSDYSSWIDALPSGWTIITDAYKIYFTGYAETPHSTGFTYFNANYLGIKSIYRLYAYTFDRPVTKIGNTAFYNLIHLYSVLIPKTVTIINDSAFGECRGLTGITIPDNVTTIENCAFEYCTTIKDVIIPSSITSISNYLFAHCFSLSSVTIPNSVTSIGEGAFLNSGLKTISISNNVTNIGIKAFTFCRSLTSFTGTYSGISSDNKCIGCNNKLIGVAWCGLTSYSIPNIYTSLGPHSFYECTLTSVTIPNSVTAIDDGAFWGCTALTSVTCEATTPPTLGSNVFYNTNDFPIYVPSASVSAYQTAWSDYASRIQAIPST